jgi:hypothetical protein
MFSFRNKGKGKSLRKRIRASIRRKSTKEKQKKLEQKQQKELAASETSGFEDTNLPEAASAASTSNGTLTSRTRKTSNFLTVEDTLQHLSLSGSDTENEV